jgi:exopolyphosphatase/guanosine-5'-triphosphate,3'-diphosphate pyrophosphatase
MLYGVIDIGSNTVRLTLFDVDHDSHTFSTFFKLKTMAGLVSYIDPKTSNMSDEGVAKLVKVLKGYLECAAKFRNLETPRAFATAGIRNAKNAEKVIQRVERECGISIDLISGSEEARLGYMGAMLQSKLTTGLQIDVGGGSTEVTTFRNGKLLHSISISQGSLSLFETYVHELLPAPVEMDRIRGEVRAAIQATPQFKGFSCQTASGVGGTVRAARRLRDAWMPECASQPNLTIDQIDEVISNVCYDPYNATRTILRVAPERAHTCIPGLVDVQTVMKCFGVQEIEVHDAGVREGYLLRHVLKWDK